MPGACELHHTNSNFFGTFTTRAELMVHVALRDCDPTNVDFRLLPDGGFEIDLGNVVVDRRWFGASHN